MCTEEQPMLLQTKRGQPHKVEMGCTLMLQQQLLWVLSQNQGKRLWRSQMLRRKLLRMSLLSLRSQRGGVRSSLPFRCAPQAGSSWWCLRHTQQEGPEVEHKAGPQDMYALAAKTSKVSDRSAGVLTGDLDLLEMLSCGLIGDRHSSDMNVPEPSINSNDDRLKFNGAYVTWSLCPQAGIYVWQYIQTQGWSIAFRSIVVCEGVWGAVCLKCKLYSFVTIPHLAIRYLVILLLFIEPVLHSLASCCVYSPIG